MEKFNPDVIKSDFKSVEIVLGIDEAGRGPVLGPMVYACAYWDYKYNNQIAKYFGFDDSKKLTPEKREHMFADINKYPDLIHYEKIVISPEELSYKMQLRQKISLNEISHNAARDLILLAKKRGANIKKVYVDTVGTPEKYKSFLDKSIKDKDMQITVEAKADAKYSCVSAASIVAKVTRDHLVEDWEFKEKGENFDKNMGSGYTSDRYTVEWLENTYDPVFGFPSIVRFSWKTIDNMFKKKGDTCEWENYKEEDENKKKWINNKISSKQKTLDFNQRNNKQNDDESKSNDDESKSNEEEQKYKNFYERNNITFDVDL